MRRINGMLAAWGEILREARRLSVRAEQNQPSQSRN